MSEKKIVVYGASGHGKVVADVIMRQGSQVVGFIDDRAKLHGESLLALPVIGTGDWLAAQDPDEFALALGIGDNRVRQAIGARHEQLGFSLVTAIHPGASVAPSATLGPGTVVMAGAVINPDAKVGKGVIVNTGAVIEHDVVAGDYCHLSPNATTGGAARIGPLAHLGLGAILLPCKTVGEGAILGAGAVAIADIPPGVVAVGVPARVIKEGR